jgi:hypothetical protein
MASQRDGQAQENPSHSKCLFDAPPIGHRGQVWKRGRQWNRRSIAIRCQRVSSSWDFMSEVDWLSHLLQIITVTGRLEVRCAYGAPWRLTWDRAAANEIPYHVIVRGRAIFEDPEAKTTRELVSGDIGTISILDDAIATFNSTKRRAGKTVIRARP